MKDELLVEFRNNSIFDKRKEKLGNVTMPVKKVKTESKSEQDFRLDLEKLNQISKRKIKLQKMFPSEFRKMSRQNKSLIFLYLLGDPKFKD